MPSNAEAYFQQITTAAEPLAFLNSQANGVFETEWLDFKGEPRPQDALKIWSEVVTGFSNTEGGVLIWGIDARYDQTTKLDVSNGTRLISNLQQFESQLRSNVVNLTTPPTKGIEIKSYATAPNGQGFVVCMIPEGTGKPYRAEIGDRYYFIRSGSSFRDANPALLRTMFYPKAMPDFAVTVSSLWNKNYEFHPEPMTNPPPLATDFMVTIANVGMVSAENLYVYCECHAGDEKTSWRIAEGRWQAVSNNNNVKGYWFPHYVNPLQQINVALCNIRLPVRLANGPYKRPTIGVEFIVSVTAKDLPPKFYAVKFDKAEIRDGGEKQAREIQDPPNESR